MVDVRRSWYLSALWKPATCNVSLRRSTTKRPAYFRICKRCYSIRDLTLCQWFAIEYRIIDRFLIARQLKLVMKLVWNWLLALAAQNVNARKLYLFVCGSDYLYLFARHIFSIYSVENLIHWNHTVSLGRRIWKMYENAWNFILREILFSNIFKYCYFQLSNDLSVTIDNVSNNYNKYNSKTRSIYVRALTFDIDSCIRLAYRDIYRISWPA